MQCPGNVLGSGSSPAEYFLSGHAVGFLVDENPEESTSEEYDDSKPE
jgi:hypothetical protein